jgi:hypothetical protein
VIVRFVKRENTKIKRRLTRNVVVRKLPSKREKSPASGLMVPGAPL